MQKRGPAMARSASVHWASDDNARTPLLVRNIVFQYIAIAVELALGIVLLPFNIGHLGSSAYGLWVLTTSVTTYFSLLELGYGSAQVKFAAQYRALRDADALNEIASTLFFLFSGLAVVVYLGAVAIAFNLGVLFDLAPNQAEMGRDVLLVVSVHAAIAFPFSVFGSITNGFQRYYLNNIIAVSTSLFVAGANVLVLLAGYGLLELVAVTTAIRVASLAAYRASAYRAFPQLAIRWRNVHRTRLREVSALSAYLLIINIARKINLAADTIVIGAFMGTAAVAVWVVAARIMAAVHALGHALTRFLFPVVVESVTQGSAGRLGLVLVEGTRLALAAVVPTAVALGLLADALVAAWVGPRFTDSVVIVQLLAVVVTIQIGTSTVLSVLNGAGWHRLEAATSVIVAVSNLVLSVVLVQRWGLPGVAVGTLLPVAGACVFVRFPAACRGAGLPLAEVLRRAVWPAVWPALPMAAGVLGLRVLLPPVGAAALMAGCFGIGVYAAVFFTVALRAEERQWYARKVGHLFRPAALAAEAKS